MRCIRACPPSTLSTKKPRAPWQDGRRAWARLNGWHQDAGASPGHPDDPEAALLALSDIALVKRLTAQAELNAVKTARSGGKSWPEIGVALGVDAESVRNRWGDATDNQT